jgi:hypothetical protein
LNGVALRKSANRQRQQSGDEGGKVFHNSEFPGCALNLDSAGSGMLIHKAHPSRWQKAWLRSARWGALIWLGFFATDLFGAPLARTEATRIGKKIWQNECNGTISGLTSWNSGENFASLGIGHFIWYPEGERGPFEESFPKLVAFITSHGTNLPDWLSRTPGSHCPWKSRAEFARAQQTAEMKQLRQFLADTIDLQSQFMVDRLQHSLPKMLAEADANERPKVQENFQSLLATAEGCYALVDYVNFKGEGILHSERYRDQGWGLLQVLEEMRPGHSLPTAEFSRSAAIVLTRRVHNAPAARNESLWLPGWLNRVNGYSRG